MINLGMLDFERGIDILITIQTLSLAFCFVRLYLGPAIPDRTVAFDTISIHAVGILALYGIRIDAPSLLDVAIVTAVLGFLGTTMLARYLERAGTSYYELSQEDVTTTDAERNGNSIPAERGKLQSS